jgi:hypothetical protein
MDFVLPFFFLFGMMVLYFTFQMVKNKGLKGALFGKPIAETVGELDLGTRRMARMRLRVHVLRSDDGRPADVGVEFTAKTFGGFSMMPVPLTVEQSKTLAMMLSDASSRAESLGRGQ